MNKRKINTFIILAALFSLLTYFHDVIKEANESPFDDFAHYWINASLLKEGYNVWSWNKEIDQRNKEIAKELNVNFTCSPIHSLGFFVLVLPFTIFPFHWTVLGFLFLEQIFIFFSIWVILKTCKNDFSLEDLMIVLFLVLSFWPIREQIHQLQPNFLILLFISIALLSMKKGHMIWAGIFLSLAIQIREYFFLIALFFLWKKNWRILFGIILGIMALKIIAIFIFGGGKELSYWKYIYSFFGISTHRSIANESLSAGIYRVGNNLFGTKICFIFWLLCIGFLIGNAIFTTRKKGVDLLMGFCLFLCLAFLVSPWVHEHHYLAMYPAIIFIWFKLGAKNKIYDYALFILAYLLLGLKYSFVRFPMFHSGILAIFTMGKVAGVAVFYFLITQLIKRDLVNSTSDYLAVRKEIGNG